VANVAGPVAKLVGANRTPMVLTTGEIKTLTVYAGTVMVLGPN
jgi:hypothetical protein